MAFWLSFFSCLIVFGYFMIYGGYIWRGDINVQFAGLVLASLAGTGWLAWRGFICKDRLPRSGLEWVFVAAVLAMLVSLAASPDPRQGVARVGWLVAYILLFYFFISLNNSGLNRWGMLAGLITIVGLVLAQALAETLNWYMSWFAAAGSFTLPASQYRFTGLLSSSNVLMALANLFVPALIYTQARTHRFGVRVLSGIWMVIYFMIVPFSSSRGGWLGLLVSLAAGTAFWAWQARPWQALTKWSRRKQVIALVTGLVILASFGFLGMRFIRTFASDPTHGSDPFGSSGRDVFWAAALKIWQQSPVAGAGPGRFGFAYWNIHPGVVPEFWPVHAHNIFFQALAETGLVGFIALISVLVFLGIGIWRRYQNAESPAKPWIAAFMAGLAGFLVQCLFDEFSAWIAVMLPVVFILAWIWSNSIPQNGYTQIRLAWLGLPIAGLLGLSAWSIWAYQPFNGWQSAALANDWRQAAESASLSAQRDPDFHFYQVEAGILWSWEWQFADDPSGLKRARACLQRATRLENVPSWVWADLAVLDYADHDAASAKIHIDRAILMSPDLPEYYLNRGNFSE
jgi:O-antigen ligase